jgi:hypothetical protein
MDLSKISLSVAILVKNAYLEELLKGFVTDVMEPG